MISNNELKKQITLLSQKILAPIDELITFSDLRDDGTPCVFIEQGFYYYFSRDRESININKKTQDLNELLYWVFYHISFSMAVKFEIENRTEGQDVRRMIFSHQLELIRVINQNWYWKARIDIAKILRDYPYNDP